MAKVAERSQVLVISPEAPYPMAGGGALRTASVLEYLASRGCRTDLVLFSIDGGWDPRTALPAGRGGEVLLLRLPRHSKAVAARIWRNTVRLARGIPPLMDRFAGFDRQLAAWLSGRRYDLVIFEHFWSAPYFQVVRPHATRTILDLHNIESEWHERLGRLERWPLGWGHRRFAGACRKLEATLLANFDQVLFPAKGEGMAIYPNAIPWHTLPATSAPERSFVFSGNLEYHPNIQAVRWFRDHVWPRLKRQTTEWRWRIVGKNSAAIEHLVRDDRSVEISGPVDDAIAELARSQTAIVPILSGSGTRIKILEAWAAGIPVVSTTIGAEGLHAVNGQHLFLADTPDSFAAAMNRLAEDAALRKATAMAGRRLYENEYTWDAAWKLLDQALGFSREVRKENV